MSDDTITFSAEDLKRIWNEYSLVTGKNQDLLIRFTQRTYTTSRAHEFGTQGFARRLSLIARCIENVFQLLPPDRTTIPTRDELSDATINIQAFVFNVFGSADNLAWVWVSEKELNIPSTQVGLREKNTLIRGSFSKEFQEHLEGMDAWFEYLENFRHALAHRIPLYIPPYVVPKKMGDAYQYLEKQKAEAFGRLDFGAYERLSGEQQQLGVFRPWITHSYEEGSRFVVFHAQLLADFNTIVELGQKMLSELGKPISVARKDP